MALADSRVFCACVPQWARPVLHLADGSECAASPPPPIEEGPNMTTDQCNTTETDEHNVNDPACDHAPASRPSLANLIEKWERQAAYLDGLDTEAGEEMARALREDYLPELRDLVPTACANWPEKLCAGPDVRCEAHTTAASIAQGMEDLIVGRYAAVEKNVSLFEFAICAMGHLR